MITNYIFSEHARFEMKRRELGEEIVVKVIEQPEQQWDVRNGRKVLQSRVFMGEPKRQYLIRAFLDVDRQPPEVVTAYKTSKIEKYWRAE